MEPKCITVLVEIPYSSLTGGDNKVEMDKILLFVRAIM